MDKQTLGLYLAMFGVTAVFTMLGIYGSGETGSLLLLAGALHVLGDGLPYVADFCKEYFVLRKNYARLLKLSILLCNAVFLIATTAYILWEAYHRFENPYLISKWVLFFALCEIAGNTFQMKIEHRLKHQRKHDDQHHIHHSQWGHLLGDVIASVLQGAGALAIVVFGVLWIDPLASVLGAALTGYLGIKGLRNFFELSVAPDGHHH